MNKMKKVFWIGFTVGIIYFLATYLYEVFALGCPWNLEESMCGLLVYVASLPSILIVETALETLGAPDIVVYSLGAVLDGIILGLVFIGIRSIFNKLFRK